MSLLYPPVLWARPTGQSVLNYADLRRLLHRRHGKNTKHPQNVEVFGGFAALFGHIGDILRITSCP